MSELPFDERLSGGIEAYRRGSAHLPTAVLIAVRKGSLSEETKRKCLEHLECCGQCAAALTSLSEFLVDSEIGDTPHEYYHVGEVEPETVEEVSKRVIEKFERSKPPYLVESSRQMPEPEVVEPEPLGPHEDEDSEW